MKGGSPVRKHRALFIFGNGAIIEMFAERNEKFKQITGFRCVLHGRHFAPLTVGTATIITLYLYRAANPDSAQNYHPIQLMQLSVAFFWWQRRFWWD